MPTLTNYYSLVEQAKRIDPNGDQARIVEVLNREMGEILTDAPWLPSNDIWVNKTTRRASLPTGQRRKLNQRITNSVSRTTEIMDVLGIIEDYCEVDAKLVRSMPSEAVFLSGEVDAFIEGIGQTVVSDILYSNTFMDPDAIHGLGPRLATLDGRFVIGAGGTGSDLTSVYAVTWGQDTAYLMHPKNMPSNMGVNHEDKGYVTSETADGKMEIHRDHFEIVFGLCVRHPRAIGRYANIEQLSVGVNTFDEDDLITLLNNMKVGPGTRLYMNETIMTQGQIRCKDKNNVYWTPGNGLSGEPFLYFSGVPCRKIAREILINTEDEIS
jgi:hypothetical protein